MAELRTEAGLLLDVLIERLGALKTAAAAEADGKADGPRATGPTADAGTAAEAGTAADPGAAETPLLDGICPTCGHDPTRLTCSGCPVCALLAVLRGERPELTATLIDGALSAMSGLRALIGEPSEGQESPSQSPPPADHGADGPGQAPAPRAERIDIT